MNWRFANRRTDCDDEGGGRYDGEGDGKRDKEEEGEKEGDGDGEGGYDGDGYSLFDGNSRRECRVRIPQFNFNPHGLPTYGSTDREAMFDISSAIREKTKTKINELDIQCQICRKVLQMAWEVTNYPRTPSDWDWKIGKMEEIFDRVTCAKHQDFFEYAINQCLGEKECLSTYFLSFGRYHGSVIDVIIRREEPYPIRISEFNRRAILVYDTRNRAKPWIRKGRELYSSVLRRDIDCDFIDPTLFRSWNEHCKWSHGTECCNQKIIGLEVPPSWLIDTKRMCLVPGAGHIKDYVALSYVWGRIPMLKTTCANLAFLQEDGAFSKFFFFGNIPPTIQHAIRIVSMLEERYLWVDALCIVQDDAIHLHHQLRHMASIYENASLTIIAADGKDANSGIPGLKGVSKPRKLPPILKLTEETSVTLSSNSGALYNSTWGKRGWTLQEQIFSTRKLIFIDGTVWWSCARGKYAEEDNNPFSGTVIPVDGYANWQSFLHYISDPTDAPEINHLETYINGFNMRDFSFETDVIPASLSIISSLRTKFPRGFVYGLPISLLDGTLTWQSNPYGPFRCRAVSGDQIAPPSWSWAGWMGGLTSGKWNPCSFSSHEHGEFAVPLPRFPNSRTIPFLEWFLQRRKETKRELIPFQNDWYDYKVRYMGEGGESLPEGWSRVNYYSWEPMGGRSLEMWLRECKNVSMDTSLNLFQRRYYYKSNAYPSARFNHPIPVGENLEPTPGGFDIEPASGRYLCAQTTQLRLWASKPHHERPEYMYRPWSEEGTESGEGYSSRNMSRTRRSLSKSTNKNDEINGQAERKAIPQEDNEMLDEDEKNNNEIAEDCKKGGEKLDDSKQAVDFLHTASEGEEEEQKGEEGEEEEEEEEEAVELVDSESGEEVIQKIDEENKDVVNAKLLEKDDYEEEIVFEVEQEVADEVTKKVNEEGANVRWQDHPLDFQVNICGYSVSGCRVSLCDNSGEAVGVLFPNLADDIQMIWDSGRQGIQVDLVAISRGHTIPHPQVRHPEDWNFYHVLWVEWIDGIAYRKGVGQVFRSAWERLGAEDVYLILG